VSTTANASHLLLELLQRGGFAASIVLWRDTENEGVRNEGTEKTTEDKDRARENKGVDEEERNISERETETKERKRR